VYSEAVALVEEYQQALSVASMGGVRDLMSVFAQLDLRSSPQTYDALEQRLAVSEAIQRLRLPLLSKDGDVPDDDTAEWGNVSRSSFDSITTSISLSTTTTVHTTTASTASATVASGSGTQAEVVEPGVGGVANRFLGISPAWLRQTHLSRSVLADVSFRHVILALHRSLSTNVLCVGMQLSNLNLGLLCSCTIRYLRP
jgi:HAUS augmin-like complex subunit 4